MSNAAALRTSAWYGDRELELPFPDSWTVSVHWPKTPRPLSDAQIEQALRRPLGQPPLAQLAQGRSRPAVILDDLTRPTPADRVLPFVLNELAAAGIPAGDVTVVVATGTHGPPTAQALAKKAGLEAATSCRLIAHDDRRDVVRVGRTSFGTPVLVNRAVAGADLVLGIGGVYPQHSTGFGGGSKLALGVLGRRSITHLHYGHPSMDGSLEIDNDFRHDLDEIARMVGMHTSISAHVDAQRRLVRLVSGAHELYYREAVAFSLSSYSACAPGNADVVISNAYPMDVSLTFMRSKGILPLLRAAPGASRVVVAACPEGVGHHGLFPFMDLPRFARARQLARRTLVDPRSAPATVRRGVARRLNGARAPAPAAALPIHLYPPGRPSGSLPAAIPGMTAVYSWDETLARVAREQGGRSELEAVVYPCAPLQVLEADPVRAAEPAAVAAA